MNRLIGLLLVAFFAAPAFAYEFQPATPLDISGIDKNMLDDIYGKWEIRNEKGTKKCKITLLKEQGIGGMQLEKDKNCEKAFPMMADITSWRLNEDWMIDLVDALRHVRVRFMTPDDRYVPFGDDKDIENMDEFNKIEGK